MIVALRALAIVAGVVIVVATLASAVKTVVLPRGEVSYLTRVVFLSVRRIFTLFARPSVSFERRDRILARFAPVALIGTLITWLVLVGAGYTLIFWGVDHPPWYVAFELSGSSLFTLGTTLARAGSQP